MMLRSGMWSSLFPCLVAASSVKLASHAHKSCCLTYESRRDYGARRCST